MSDKKYAKLVMVTADNNNKYYEMTWDGGSTFTAVYGRIKSTAQTINYPYSQWQSKYNEKIKKGYKDVTHTVSTTVETTEETVEPEELKQIEDAKVATFFESNEEVH